MWQSHQFVRHLIKPQLKISAFIYIYIYIYILMILIWTHRHTSYKYSSHWNLKKKKINKSHVGGWKWLPAAQKKKKSKEEWWIRHTKIKMSYLEIKKKINKKIKKKRERERNWENQEIRRKITKKERNFNHSTKEPAMHLLHSMWQTSDVSLFSIFILFNDHNWTYFFNLMQGTQEQSFLKNIKPC